jgi:ribokinase
VSLLVLGALHHDVIVSAPRLPALDETLVGQGVRYVFGGKGGNQAVAAVRMGARVAMAGAVGRDAAGETLLAALDAAGVDRASVKRVDTASGMSVAIEDAGGSYGAVIVSAANLAITGDLPIPDGTTHLLLQSEIPEAANLAAARAAHAAGARVLLNAAPARPLPSELLALTDILVVNRVEAAQLSGAPENDPNQAAKVLLARGPASVIVTLGADGLICRNGESPALADPALPVSVISTHGAGDAFIGALAARLDAGEALSVTLGFAQAAAALHVSTPVAERKALSPEAVRRFLSAH